MAVVNHLLILQHSADDMLFPLESLSLFWLLWKSNIGIKHGFSCINIRQVPWEALKTEAGGRGLLHLPRNLANVNALKNHVRSLLLHKNWEKKCHISRYFLHYFFSPFHRCRANAICTDYARSRAEQYTSRDGSKSLAPVRAYWKLRSRALTARELPC